MVRSSSVSGSLLGIAEGDDLKPVYARRARRDDEKTVTATTTAALALKIVGVDGPTASSLPELGVDYQDRSRP